MNDLSNIRGRKPIRRAHVHNHFAKTINKKTAKAGKLSLETKHFILLTSPTAAGERVMNKAGCVAENVTRLYRLARWGTRRWSIRRTRQRDSYGRKSDEPESAGFRSGKRMSVGHY